MNFRKKPLHHYMNDINDPEVQELITNLVHYDPKKRWKP